MTTSTGQSSPTIPATAASKKHLQIVQDAEKTVATALQQMSLDKDLLTTEAWDEFSIHVTTFMRELYNLSVKNKHALDSNISRSCVSRAHTALTGRSIFSNIIGSLGGALLGAGVSLVLGIQTATLASSTSNWLWTAGSSVLGLLMVAYQFHKKT